MSDAAQGMGINIVRANGETESVGSFELISMPYYDIVFAGTPINLGIGDQIEISFDVPIVYAVDGIERSRMVDKWAYTIGELEEALTVSIVRIIKVGDEAWIDLSDDMPEPQIPSGAKKAKKIG